MRILYNFASRERPEKFFQALDNIDALSIDKEYSVRAKLDYDDGTMYNNQTLRRLSNYMNMYVSWGASKSKVDAINRGIQDIGWDIMVVMSDDMRFTAYGFDETIKNQFRKSGLDSFLHFPDSYADYQARRYGSDRVCTMSIIGSTYYQRFGYVYHPDYYSLWCDNEATEVAKRLGKYVPVNFEIFVHEHYSPGLAVKDKLYWRNDTYNKDKEIFEARKAKNFDL